MIQIAGHVQHPLSRLVHYQGSKPVQRSHAWVARISQRQVIPRLDQPLDHDRGHQFGAVANRPPAEIVDGARVLSSPLYVERFGPEASTIGPPDSAP